MVPRTGTDLDQEGVSGALMPSENAKDSEESEKGGKSRGSQNYKRTQILLRQDEWQAIRKKAFDEERSYSSVIREVIRSFFDLDAHPNSVES